MRFVTKKVHDKNERYDINELEALELVLRKYIDISELLNNIPDMSIDYYKTYEVPFSKGDIVDFDDISNPKLYKKWLLEYIKQEIQLYIANREKKQFIRHLRMTKH